MSDLPPPPIERHEAADRFGKTALRTAHRLTAALAESGADEEPILVRTDGPHRTLDGLAALIDAALADNGAQGTAAKGSTGDADGDDAAAPS
jgi:hypothetical protein